MSRLRSTVHAVPILVAALGALAGCSGDVGPRLTPSPSHASLFGYVDVTFTGDVASLGDIESVTLAGVPAYRIRATATTLTVTIQGAPKEGPAELIVLGSKGRAAHPGAFTYDPPSPGVPRLWAAFGASITQGTEGGGIDEHTQTFGVTGQIARAVGAYLPLPIFADGLTPPLGPGDFNPDCSQKPNTGIDPTQLLDRITDPMTKLFDLRRARASFATVPHNFAVGGSKVSDVETGGSGGPAILEHIIEEPTIDPGEVVGKVDISQIDRLEMLDPEVVFCTDLFANDTDPAITSGDDVHPERITPLDQVRPMLVEMMGRLGKLHGQYFIANLLSLTVVPSVAQVRARRIAAGTDTAASFDAKLKVIDDAIDAYNAALVDAMQPHPNLHLLDFHARIAELVQSGVDVGGEHLTLAQFGGFLSFDGLHPSDTGYASLANFFLDGIDAVLGTHTPRVDVAAVLAQDPADPAKLKAAGFTCVP